MKTILSAASVCAVVGFGLLTSCARENERVDEAATSTRELGQVPAPESAFDAVGQIWGVNAWVPAQGKIALCGAVLIGEDKILTSSSCNAFSSATEFRLGVDAAAPTQVIPVVGSLTLTESDPLGTGSGQGYGYRASLLVGLLEHAVAGVSPMKLGDFSRANLNTQVAVVSHETKSRSRGAMTVRALTGDQLGPLYFASEEDLKAAFKPLTNYKNLTDAKLTAEAHWLWERRVTTNEAIVGGAAGDATSQLSMAMGGAVVVPNGTDWTLVGVVTGNHWVGQVDITAKPWPDTALWVNTFSAEARKLITDADSACRGATNWSDGLGCSYTYPTVLSGPTVLSAKTTTKGYVGTLSGVCSNKQWTQVTDTCRAGLTCGGGTFSSVGGCRYTYPGANHGDRVTVTNETAGHTGELSGLCDDGWWTQLNDTCQ